MIVLVYDLFDPSSFFPPFRSNVYICHDGLTGWLDTMSKIIFSLYMGAFKECNPLRMKQGRILNQKEGPDPRLEYIHMYIFSIRSKSFIENNKLPIKIAIYFWFARRNEIQSTTIIHEHGMPW